MATSIEPTPALVNFFLDPSRTAAYDLVKGPGVPKKRLHLDPKVREALQELGRIGGQLGGRRRAERLTAEQRRAIARKAALVRWRKTSQ